MAARKVTITLTSKIVDYYEARSYPDDDRNNDGLWELYKVPVYEILVEGTDDAGNATTYKHQAPRFMPYYNDPANPDAHYSSRGWVNAGLSAKRTVVVTRYKENYEVQNRYSPGKGAIVLKGAFYIHAGPADLSDIGFGSAGCVEIIGNYDDFKAHIASLSGTGAKTSDEAINKLVGARKLIVEIEQATVPDINKSFTRKVRPF
ncbi:MAG: hypothetical protein L0Z62_36975 [Gemmataceae bacterium]|nr:hypothetical protein [Gemmataceae bacterium]